MRFWDASALSCICSMEPHSAMVRELSQADPEMVVWWGSRTECLSALARASREGRIDAPTQGTYRARLQAMTSAWREVAPEESVRAMADRLPFVHPLRAADALQLAAALQWCGNAPAGMAFVTLDRRLGEAARKEGFTVLP